MPYQDHQLRCLQFCQREQQHDSSFWFGLNEWLHRWSSLEVSNNLLTNFDDSITMGVTPQFIVHRHDVQCSHLIHGKENSVLPITLFVEKNLELIHGLKSVVTLVEHFRGE